MIKSMTGYGRAEETVDSMNIVVEIKSVNHRYFEFFAKVPRVYGFLEEKLKAFTNSLVTLALAFTTSPVSFTTSFTTSSGAFTT